MHLTKAEVRYLRSLAQKKVRAEERKFLLEGWKPIRDALRSGAGIELLAHLEHANASTEHAAILNEAKAGGIAIKELSEIELRQVSDTMQSQGVVALVQQREFSLEDLLRVLPPRIVACDEVNDPGNLGSIIRSADWFGVDAVLLSAGCVSLYNEKVVRATAGSLFHVQVVEESDFVRDLPSLRKNGYTVIATAADGSMTMESLRGREKLVLVFGSEAHGLRPEVRALADGTAGIPKYGLAESLNVGVACGIFLSALRRSP